MPDTRGETLANLLDAHGHRVTAKATGTGLLVILTLNAGSGLRDGHPCVDRDQARVLRDALTDFIDNDPEARNQ